MATANRPIATPAPEDTAAETTLPNGEAAAALLAAGVGSAAMGIITTLSEVNTNFSTTLQNLATAMGAKGVGPLAGKTTIAVAIWLVAWLGLYLYYRDKSVDFVRYAIVALVLVAVGFIGTFPTFFDFVAKLFGAA